MPETTLLAHLVFGVVLWLNWSSSSFEMLLVISDRKKAKSYAGVKRGQLGPRQREGGWKHAMEV